MAKISDKQLAIFRMLRDEGEMKRSEIIQRVGHWYYCNAEKHVSEMLHRMVKSGSIVKPRHGWYAIGAVSPRPHTNKKTQEEKDSENQLDMWNETNTK